MSGPSGLKMLVGRPNLGLTVTLLGLIAITIRPNSDVIRPNSNIIRPNSNVIRPNSNSIRPP